MTHQRVLNVSGGFNFRELGGYPTADGKTIKWQRVIRTATLAHLTDADQQLLLDYGIKYDVDFRSNDEVTKAPDQIPAVIDYQHLPVFPEDKTQASKTEAEIKAELQYKRENGRQHMIDTYREMIELPQSHNAYRQFFNTLLNNTNGDGVLFHCTAGKDRTGMGAVFFLSALGVDHDLIRQDYLLTNQTLSPLIQNRLTKARENGMTGSVLESLKALISVSGDYFDTAMATIQADYGDMNQFLTEALSLSTTEINDLKQLYLTK